MVSEFETQLQRTLERHGLSGRSLLLAVSGGADSLALLEAMARLTHRVVGLKIRIEAATVDHHLQPGSAAVAKKVAATAEGLGVVCHVVGLKLDGSARGLEATARLARYEALERLRAERGLDLVATAHTASDQAETVLMRLVRGASLAGAAAILERRADRVVRPLLFATRGEVEAYLSALGETPWRDPMNDDPAFLRVRIRRDVVPTLTDAAGFDVQPALARFARLAADDDRYLAELARHAFDRCQLERGTLDRISVLALAPALRRRVVVMLLEGASLPVDAALVDDALRALDRSTSAPLPADHVLTCANDRVQVVAAPARRGSLHESSR